MPQRIQRKRTKGWRLPAHACVVTRPTRWGNPFLVREHGLDNALLRFGEYLAVMSTEELRALLVPLRGKDLACYCALGQPCHADIWLRLANT